MELSDQKKVRMLWEKGTYKYSGILEADTIKQEEMKEKIKKEHIRRTRKLLGTKLSSRNIIHIYQPLRSGRIWHKVNFLSGV